jgi:uncharacterized phage protein gp47/JayE
MSGSVTPPPLALLDQPTLVQRMAAAAQGACSALLDFTVGAVLRALVESVASVQLWLQWLILLVWQRARLSTASGADCDSWGADFGFTRLPAVAATGSVTFSRFTPTVSALVPLNAQVKTSDGTQAFIVTEDSTNPLWSSARNGYVLPASTASVTVPVEAIAAGSAGNVQPNTVALIGSAIPGIDTVNNAQALTNGADAETDAAFRLRFQLYLQSLARATLIAIRYAISTVQQGLTAAIVESVGSFAVFVDDGSGDPPDSLITAVALAVDDYRGLSISFTVQRPSLIGATIVLTITAAPGYAHGNLVGPVATAIEAFVNALPIGAALPYTRIAALAYSVPGVSTVESMTLNSGTADIGGSSSQVVRVASVTVN